MIRSLLCAIAVFAAACKSPTPQHDDASSQTASLERKVLINVPLAHDSLTGNVSTPLLHGTVKGHDIRFLIDSGASESMLTASFARSLGLAISRADAFATGAGDSSVVVGFVPDITATSSSQTIIHWQRGPVIEVPPDVEAMGIGAILSPQTLGPPNSMTILDFRNDRLAVETGSLTPNDRFGPAKSLAPDGLRVCRLGERAKKYLLHATIGNVSGWLEMDSGASETHFLRDSVAGAGMKTSRRKSAAQIAVVGGIVPSVRADPIDLRMGELHLLISPLIVAAQEDPQCPAMGVIGMDILRSCMAIVDDNGGYVRCWL
jgi:hypothetical protein